MNEIKLKGVIRNIQPSHSINGVDYLQADVITKRVDSKEDIVSIKFKKYNNRYNEEDNIELVGNIRSYSKQLEDGTSHVNIYVFTYQDLPDDDIFNNETTNEFHIDGRICKKDKIHTTTNGKQNIHFILANNIFTQFSGQKINNYLPCVAWGRMAWLVDQLEISDQIEIRGQLHSRTYRKTLDNGEIEFRVAHELVINDLKLKDLDENYD